MDGDREVWRGMKGGGWEWVEGELLHLQPDQMARRLPPSAETPEQVGSEAFQNKINPHNVTEEGV